MKIAIGATILLIGLFVFRVDASRVPLDAGYEFMSGYFLPSGVIIVIGIVILVWNSKKVPRVTLIASCPTITSSRRDAFGRHVAKAGHWAS